MPDIHQEPAGLQRDVNEMPDDVLAELTQRGLVEDNRSRPGYQQNDYLGWIGRAKRDDTRRKRIDQMLEELSKGGVYMGMAHAPSDKSSD